MSDLSGKRVLVTGATGFIGQRLATRLLSEEGAHVTATGRNIDAIQQLAQMGANLQRAHLLDFATAARLLEGQDLLFHVAAWLGPRHGPAEDAWALNAYATEQLVRIAADSGVSRVILLSSIAVYGPPTRPIIDEAHPLDTQQSSIYGRTKAEGELRARKVAAEEDLELVIARPGVVYGPGSFGWSRRMVQFVRRGVPVIFGKGLGHAHPVFIENLIDGLIQAAAVPAAAGNAFNFVDQSVTWRDWFGYFGAMCGRKPRRLPLALAKVGLRLAPLFPLGLSIDRDLFAYYNNRSQYATERARTLLGHAPRVSLREGMARTEAWLRREGEI